MSLSNNFKEEPKINQVRSCRCGDFIVFSLIWDFIKQTILFSLWAFGILVFTNALKKL